MNRYLAVDIGGSSIKYGVYRLHEETAVLESEGSTPVPDSLSDLSQTVARLANSCAEAEPAGIAVSLPGLIDSEKGFAVHGGALQYIKYCEIKRVLQGAMAIPVTVENDGKCAALGESWAGELKNITDGVVIVLGTGIGGGIIANGRLLRGAHLSAGEFSFIQTSNSGDLSANSFAKQNGVSYFLHRYAKAVKKDFVDGRRFFDILESGDEVAIDMFRDYTRKLAFQIINMQNILDPQKFVISGGISSRQVVTDMIADSVKDLRDQIIRKGNYFFPEPLVVRSQLGNLSNQYGAIKRFLELQNPRY